MGRAPNLLELGIFSVMWSEHCSYKSSKKWLKTLPTKGPQVIKGPGENAGVIDIGEGLAAIFKIKGTHESASTRPSKKGRPSVPPSLGSARRSGCGMRPSTVLVSL